MAAWEIVTDLGTPQFNLMGVYLNSKLLRDSINQFSLEFDCKDAINNPSVATLGFLPDSSIEIVAPYTLSICGQSIGIQKLTKNYAGFEIEFLCLVRRILNFKNCRVIHLEHFANTQEFIAFKVASAQEISKLVHTRTQDWCRKEGYTDLQIVNDEYWAIAPHSFIPQPIPADIRQIELECRTKVLASVN